MHSKKRQFTYVKEVSNPLLKLQPKDWFLILGEVAFFSIMLPLMWLDEVIDLNSLLPWMPPLSPKLQEYVIETSVILIIAIAVITTTVVVLKRIRRIERFLRVCAWCRKVWVDGKWVLFEDYALSKHSLRSSHGICDECMTGLEMKRQEKKADKSMQLKIPPVGDKVKDKPIQ
jgi:hypothetical protein